MAAASTNGQGNGEEHSSGSSAPSTHESGDAAAAAETSDADLDVLSRGSTLGRYLVLERLGAGAMGVVYAAYDPELDRKVAIKILRPHGGGDQERRRARLVREAKAIAKVSHPNVVGIFDVGVHQGQVFLAMEYLAGGTLRDWLAAEKRPWGDIVKMFIEVGKGLAGAHAEGLIHRDFKPDNVLVDKNGAPKVVDFGLVRLSTTLETTSSGGGVDDADIEPSDKAMAASPPGLMVLTKTGAMAGTPAYMAPEQFLGTGVDARTDQFALCVALYEALYGERPFAGETIIALATSVTEERVREAPTNASAPPWIRRILLKGLRANPNDRHSSIEALSLALLDDPQIARQRRFVKAGAVLALLSVVLGARYWSGRRQGELDRQASDKVHAAETLLADVPSLTAQYRDQRRKALALFDSGQSRQAEVEWKQVLGRWTKVDELATSAIGALDAARALRPSVELDAQLTRVLVDHARRAEYADHFDAATAVLGRLPQPSSSSSVVAGSLAISTSSYPARVAIFRYRKTASGSLEQTPIRALDLPGPVTQELPRGSYFLSFSSPGRAPVAYPVFLRMGESIQLSVVLPPADAVPPGFAYVPSGRFLVGDFDENLRTGFTNAVPLHDQITKGFLIAKTELTFAEWIRFLRALPPSRLPGLLPRTSASAFQGLAGAVELQPSPRGPWRLTLTPVTTPYHAAEGEEIIYSGRDIRARQNWLRMPVTGVSVTDIQQYAKWLSETGRVPGARLCDESEWERAARGADDRRFPNGGVLLPGDANHDITYGRVGTAFGPDEAGSYPASRSPFDLDDTAGNVWEITTTHAGHGEVVLRGGSYFHFEKTELVTNREPFAAAERSAHVGTRICADLPPGIEPSRFAVQHP